MKTLARSASATQSAQSKCRDTIKEAAFSVNLWQPDTAPILATLCALSQVAIKTRVHIDLKFISGFLAHCPIAGQQLEDTTVITAFLFRRSWTGTEPFLTGKYGFPEMDCNSGRRFAEHYLSRAATWKIERVEDKIASFSDLFYMRTPWTGELPWVWLPILVSGLGALIWSLVHGNEGFFVNMVLAVVGVWLFAEPWSIICVLWMKHRHRQMSEDIGMEIRKIVLDDEADYRLAEQVSKLLTGKVVRLAYDDLQPNPEKHLSPGDENDRGWRVHGVQYHRASNRKSLAGRDVTITFASDTDTLVGIVPAQDTVEAWLQYAVRDIGTRTRKNTHVASRLWEISNDPANVLKEVWSPSRGILDRVGELEVTAERPFDERPVVQIYGTSTQDGSVLLEGIVTEGLSIIVAPVMTIRQIATSVTQLLETHPNNPAVVALEASTA